MFCLVDSVDQLWKTFVSIVKKAEAFTRFATKKQAELVTKKTR